MGISPLISIILALALVGLVVYLVVTYIPMPAPFKTVIIAVAAIVLILWLIQGGLGIKL